MVWYKCPYCSYNSERKSNLRNHFNKKNKCDERVVNLDISECKIKTKKETSKKQIEKLKKQVEEQEEKLKDKDKKIEELADKPVVNITNNIIVINNYKDPSLDHIKISDISHAIIDDHSFAEFFDLIYFHKNAPQNHSIYYPNKRENSIHVFQGGKFKTLQLGDFKKDFLMNHVPVVIKELVEDTPQQPGKFGEFADSIYKRNKDQEEKDCDLMLLRAHDNKNIVKKTKKLIDT